MAKGCDKEDSDGTCLRCKSGFTLNEETKECISNCQELMKPSNLCEYCEYGYIKIDDDKTCYSVLENNEKENSNGMKIFEFNVALNLVLILFLFY